MPSALTCRTNEAISEEKIDTMRDQGLPVFNDTQFICAAIPELRELHDSTTKSFLEGIRFLGIVCDLLGIHDAVYEMRRTVDQEFTSPDWSPHLPGDKIKPAAVKDQPGLLPLGFTLAFTWSSDYA